MSHFRIVDVCGTLVMDDTTLGLLRWHFARCRKWRFWLLQILTLQWSPMRLLVVASEKVMGRHLLKHCLVCLLNGDAVEDVERSAAQYADWLLAHRRVMSVREILSATQDHGTLILASASLEPVVKALASRLGSDYVASRLATRDGCYLGRYETDLTGRKLDALDAMLPSGWREAGYIAISDNLTDRSLLAGAARACVVLHSSRHRERWEGMKAEYLFV